MLTTNNLSGEDFLVFVLEAFDTEVERSLGEEVIINFFTEKHLSFNAITYFNKISIIGLCDIVYETESLLVFLSNLEMKIKMYLSLREVSFNEIVNLTKGAICTDINGGIKGSLSPNWFKEMTETSDEFYSGVASSNNWILILFLILMFFQETSTWTSVKQIVTNDAKPGVKP